jgi:quercetin dioxygenase-like cupin family protein
LNSSPEIMLWHYANPSTTIAQNQAPRTAWGEVVHMADRLVARTPGAKRAGPGEYLFNLGNLNHILGGPDYSTANGSCVEGDRMIVGLMRMPAGTGAAPHSHPNEQWIYILEGTFIATIGGDTIEAKPGSVVYVPANVMHSGGASADADVVFFTVKDASHGLHGVKA